MGVGGNRRDEVSWIELANHETAPSHLGFRTLDPFRLQIAMGGFWGSTTDVRYSTLDRPRVREGLFTV